MLHFLGLFYRSSKYQQHWTLLNTFQFPTVKTSSRKNLYFNSFLIFMFLIKSRSAENFGNVPLSQIDEKNSLFSNFELSNIKLKSLNSKNSKRNFKFLCGFLLFISRISQRRNCRKNRSSSENSLKLQTTCNLKHYEKSSFYRNFRIKKKFSFSLPQFQFSLLSLEVPKALERLKFLWNE